MTSKLTREQLHERARENVKALKMASRQHAFESAREEILADLQLAELAQRARINAECGEHLSPAETIELVEALEKAKQRIAELEDAEKKLCAANVTLDARAELAERQLESRTVKLPDGWQFEECEIEGCENGAIFSVGTGSRNIHLCDKCAHEPQNSRLKKSPLSKRLPFKMSAGIKVEAE
ncbi:TPA: hypothetical protein ACN7NB_000706 [Klebsiella pneumoniae]